MANFDLEYVNCNFCGQTNTKLYVTASYIDYLNRRPEVRRNNALIFKNEELVKYKFSLVRCKDCGLIYVNPRPAYLSGLYGDDYFSYYADTKSEAYKKRQGTFKAEIAELESLTKKLKLGRKILDVGCGGRFLFG